MLFLGRAASLVFKILASFHMMKAREIRVLRVLKNSGPCIDRIGPNHRIGPEIGIFLCLTDCFFFTRMMCIKDYVFSAICMHLNILKLI